ncbi:RING [Nesidiocoris tenuis]|uniref:RING-type E3 ubiquitin transferase n=1 Tax=Nesidiocoris tenuis TaxID=355587 RepID=A0ABN7BG61_9HEMI|nr:RING [Nesidiocoris tenuis]
MSDVTPSSERALRPLPDESGSSSSDSGLIRTKIEQSPSPPLRPSSPEAACPICLEDINNSSVTNSCAHRFCFTCLCEWSKVKPECPLCKQRFTIIFHSIKSMIDFQEYRLDQALLEPRLDPPRIFLALQQGSRPAFGYRTTMGFHGFTTAVPRVSSRSRMMAAHGLLPPGARVSSGGFPPSSVPNSTGRVNSSSNRSTLEFRRNVYRHNLWVRPPADQDRVRESSPEFYRMNPATTHRLAVWLSRELSVLLEPNLRVEVGVEFESGLIRENTCRGILNLLYTYRINSPDFRRIVQPHFGDRTLHFSHEFYHFAISPHDLPAYDAHARYVNGTEDGAADEPSIDAPIDEFGRPFLMGNQGSYPALHGSAATMELNDHIRSVAHGLFADLRHTARQIAMTRNRRSGTPLSSFVDSLSTNLRRSSISPPLPLLRPERPAPEVITLSSDDGDLVDDASDDSDVQIIGSLPPHHLRPPLELTDSDDSDVIVIPAPPPPIIEIDDDDDDEPSAFKASAPSSPVSCAGGPSTSNCGEGPSTLNASALTEKRSARFTRPFYCEFSSSSDEKDDVDHAQPKKSSPTKRKTRPKKRLRNYKSSKYVDDGSDSGSEEDKAEIRDGKDEGSGESAEDSTWRTSNRKSGRSRKNSSSSSKTSRKKDAQSSVSRRETSSKTRKAVNSRKDPVDGVSSDDDVCSQCGNAKNRQSVTESKARRKRRNTCGCRQAKKKRRRSTLSSGDLTSESARAASSSVVEKPKALSKKDIILNKRRSELSAIMNSADDQEASHKRRPAFDVDVQVDDSRSSLKSETDDDKSNDTILSMGQECTTLAAVSNASSALSGASFSSSPHRTPYEIPGDMSPPNLRRFDDTTPASGAFAPYYPRSSSSASTSTSSSSLSPSVRGGPPRLKSIVVRPTPTYWSPTSPTQRPSTCTDDSNDNFDF